MSIINWEKQQKFKCPKCGKKLIVSTQDSMGYGVNSFLEDGDSGEMLEEEK